MWGAEQAAGAAGRALLEQEMLGVGILAAVGGLPFHSGLAM